MPSPVSPARHGLACPAEFQHRPDHLGLQLPAHRRTAEHEAIEPVRQGEDLRADAVPLVLVAVEQP